jgi:hypothetical protein
MNHQEPLPPLSYNDRLKAVNDWVDTLNPSGNTNRLRKYLTQCINWYHGRSHYGWHTNVEYRIRWRNHMLWAISSPILEYDVSFFHKSEVDPDFIPEWEQVSFKKIEDGVYDENFIKPDRFFDPKCNIDKINIPDEQAEKKIKNKIKLSANRPLSVSISTQIPYTELSLSQEPTVTKICQPKEPTTAVVDNKEYFANALCSACKTVHRFDGDRSDTNVIGKVRKRGFFNRHELLTVSKEVDSGWTIVNKGANSRLVSIKEQNWGENYYAVLNSKEALDAGSLPNSLSPYYEDMKLPKNISKKKKSKQLKRNHKVFKSEGENKTVKGKDIHLLSIIKHNYYPNSFKPKCSEIKRTYFGGEMKYVSVRQAFEHLYKKTVKNNKNPDVAYFMDYCSTVKSTRIKDRNWAVVYKYFFTFNIMKQKKDLDPILLV